jgi:[protein-PII] uridylyltransferase
MARRLGYTAHPGLKDVERFMKHYFLMAKDVGDLTAILCAELEERQAKAAPTLSRVMARLRRPALRKLKDNKDFISDNNRITIADDGVFSRDPVNLIRIFHLAQKHNLALHPDAMRTITRSLKLIDAAVRNDPEANALFIDILTSKKDPETVLRRMNEAGVLGKFVQPFGKIVAMMQFNMYHHYTVDEHLLRCIGVLRDIERGDTDQFALASELFKSIRPQQRKVLYVTMFLHDVAKGQPEDHSTAGARVARRLCPRFGLSNTDTELCAWLIEQHLTMSTVAQSRDLSDRRTIENFAAVVQSVERLKLLTILTTADIRAVGPGVWNGWKAQLLRTLYYETEPVLTGGYSEVNRAQRVASAQADFRAMMRDWPPEQLDTYMQRLYPAYWLKVDLPRTVAQAHFLHAAETSGKKLATTIGVDAARGVTELTVLAPDHPWLLSIIAGACAAAGANIIDAQIYTTTDGLALDTISLSREFDMDEDEMRRAVRIAEAVEQALRGDLRLPETATKRPGKARSRTFVLEPAVTINNQWSHRYTMVVVIGLDRPGLLHELTAALSKLNLNIISAHVATFGERVVDVFYVTDLMGAQITSPMRQAAIKRALLGLFPKDAEPRSVSLAAAPRSGMKV